MYYFYGISDLRLKESDRCNYNALYLSFKSILWDNLYANKNVIQNQRFYKKKEIKLIILTKIDTGIFNCYHNS
jgi:hypothetical protein